MNAVKQVLALLADIANGIFSVYFAGLLLDLELSWWFFPIGIALAMLPDLDAIPELLTRGRVGSGDNYFHDHREGLHYPVVFTVVGVVLYFYLGYWGLVFLFATHLHFLNDLYGTGWGIPLFWPFSKRRFKLLGRRVNRLKHQLIEDSQWEGVSQSERRLRLVVSWSSDELSQYIEKWGMEDWIERWYMRVNWISGIEYTLFTLAVMLILVSLL